MKELIEIQSRLHAPKDNRNNFGNYNYRSAEDILENVKPILKEVKCTLILEDEIIMVADRIYVKATARLQNSTGEVEEASAFAREEETKKGYDAAQITGSASSYARKYALNGLFCIDDTKDPDVTNTHGKDEQEAPKKESKPATKKAESTPAPQSVTEQDIDSMILDIMSSNSRKEIEDKFKAYKQYDGESKKITSACRARCKELGV